MRKRNVSDYIGKRYSKLTIIEEAPAINKATAVKCYCSCGEFKTALLKDILRSSTTSCGCNFTGNPTHGLSNTTEYFAWLNAKQRCYNKTNRNYPNYGGRGIIVCDRWLNSVENFIADMGLKPSPDMSLDRKDVNGNYEPNNCRWATDIEQQNNRRNNVKKSS